jgi:DNA-binding NarL/FixJ family response regulator
VIEPVNRNPRVLIVDDHPVAADGTRRALEEGGGLDVVGLATTAAAALADVDRIQPDIVILDIHLPDMNGIELAQRIRRNYPAVAIVVLTGYDDIGYERALNKLGVSAYLQKTSAGADIATTVRAVARGGPITRSSTRHDFPDSLTERETEVLQLVAAGFQNQEIADELQIKLRTVEFHITNILEKLGARSRADARAAAQRYGWATAPDRTRWRGARDA